MSFQTDTQNRVAQLRQPLSGFGELPRARQGIERILRVVTGELASSVDLYWLPLGAPAENASESAAPSVWHRPSPWSSWFTLATGALDFVIEPPGAVIEIGEPLSKVADSVAGHHAYRTDIGTSHSSEHGEQG